MVSDNPKHQWWNRLRDVESSFVTNKNDTEKFVYYEGPTKSESPLKIDFERPKITFTPKPIFPNSSLENGIAGGTPKAPRKAFYIRVAGEEVSATMLEIRGQETFDISDTQMMDRESTRAAMLKTLCDSGLNTSEANGLLDCRGPQFFETTGERIIFLLHRNEYDAICPLVVRPKPTELERVGLVLTELEVN